MKIVSSLDEYETLYHRSNDDPDSFWREMATRLDWFRSPEKISGGDFNGDVSIRWFEDGILNACYNCVDRHLPHKANDIALIWEGDEPGDTSQITYGELKDNICRLANALKSMGISRGDTVTIYMPMVPQAVYAMLACARIGAIHSVVFGGFSADALRDRIVDCGSKIVLTANCGRRGGKTVPLKSQVDTALSGIDHVETVLVLAHTGCELAPVSGRDRDWETTVASQPVDCTCEAMNAEDPLFILYTSGSTGKPKGVLHTTGGYLLYSALTHEQSFGWTSSDVYWCTADIGWITGHSYIVYGPLANGATTLIFEGVPHYPDWSRFWQVVDKHGVSIFYTAPTAIRSILSQGDDYVRKTSRKSLRVLGSVGEPINPEAWNWYHDIVGERRCPVIDTWWQTETGGHMITPLPGTFKNKPGSATRPFFGVQPEIVDAEGNILTGPAEGNLVIARSWPGMMRSLYRDHARFIETYFSTYKGFYFTGDGVRRDDDGDYWITGRVDDVINVSGHRFGTAEIEAAINRHADVAESAVVGYPHDLKGQGIYAFVTLNRNSEADEKRRAEIVQTVRAAIGPIATPDRIHWARALPKTRSGKIMRRILRKIADGDTDNLGDISTLAEPGIVRELIDDRNADA